LSVPLGSAAAPTVFFTGDSNTGIYSPGADQVAISTGGSQRVTVDSSGNLLINTTSNSSQSGTFGQSIRGSNPGLTFIGTEASGAIRTIYESAGNLIFYNGTGGTEIARFDSSNRLGVGTSSVGARFHIEDTDSSSAYSTASILGTQTSVYKQIVHTNQNTGTNEAGIVLRAGTSSNIAEWGISALRTGATSGDLVFRSRTGASTSAEFMRLDSSGRVGIGTSVVNSLFEVRGTSDGQNILHLSNNAGASDGAVTNVIRSTCNGNVNWSNLRYDAWGHFWYVNGSERMRLDSSGRLGIGTTSVNAKLEISGNSGGRGLRLSEPSGEELDISAGAAANDPARIATSSGSGIAFAVNGTSGENVRIDSSGRLLVGTSTGSAKFEVLSNSTDTSFSTPYVNYAAVLRNDDQTNNNYSGLSFNTKSSIGGDTTVACIAAQCSNHANGSVAGTLGFFTTGSSTLAERFRITSVGHFLIGKTATDLSTDGHNFYPGGVASHTTSGDAPLYLNRNVSDGDLVAFRRSNTSQGSISVSGTTVSYNGAHLSRWSQLPGGATREEILRGTVLSNIDEMCDWGEEDNEQLNRMKVSDVEGDKNVSGVFQAWDDDDDTYTDDFYCAMTGDFIIRIAEGVTVERGDLLMSAGDGTAKPQDDDIIRSKTVAKVTSTNVSCTYEDGSYCVPCVLMAC
jgi:hypothetical protein